MSEKNMHYTYIKSARIPYGYIVDFQDIGFKGEKITLHGQIPTESFTPKDVKIEGTQYFSGRNVYFKENVPYLE